MMMYLPESIFQFYRTYIPSLYRQVASGRDGLRTLIYRIRLLPSIGVVDVHIAIRGGKPFRQMDGIICDKDILPGIVNKIACVIIFVGRSGWLQPFWLVGTRGAVDHPPQLTWCNIRVVRQVVDGGHCIGSMIDYSIALHGQQVARQVVRHALTIGTGDECAVRL